MAEFKLRFYLLLDTNTGLNFLFYLSWKCRPSANAARGGSLPLSLRHWHLILGQRTVNIKNTKTIGKHGKLSKTTLQVYMWMTVACRCISLDPWTKLYEIWGIRFIWPDPNVAKFRRTPTKKCARYYCGLLGTDTVNIFPSANEIMFVSLDGYFSTRPTILSGWILHSSLSFAWSFAWNCFTQFLSISEHGDFLDISQDSVATRSSCGVIFNNHFTATG